MLSGAHSPTSYPWITNYQSFSKAGSHAATQSNPEPSSREGRQKKWCCPQSTYNKWVQLNASPIPLLFFPNPRSLASSQQQILQNIHSLSLTAADATNLATRLPIIGAATLSTCPINWKGIKCSLYYPEIKYSQWEWQCYYPIQYSKWTRLNTQTNKHSCTQNLS